MTDRDTGAPQEPGFDASSTITPGQSLVEGVGASLIADASTLGGGLQGVEAAQSRSQEELDREAFERDWAIHGRGVERE